MATLLGVPPRRLAAWEKGEAEPDHAVVGRVLAITRNVPGELLRSLTDCVVASSLPRALSRTERLNLQAVSGPAVEKRPSIVEWIGKDLAPLATGVLRDMLEDRELQRAIARREVVSVVTTAPGVLRTGDEEVTKLFRTTINYFFHDGVLYSDAIAVHAAAGERIGFTPIAGDEITLDLFGDRAMHDAALAAAVPRPARFARG